MYLNFYQLAKEPFHVTPDPDFLYFSESHKQALAAIVYGVDQRKGFITITGPVGSGKTTTLRRFLQQADTKRLKVIYIFNPVVPFGTLVMNLCREFDLQPNADDVPGAVDMLYEALADHYSRGYTIVLLIDEAQNMPVETLERLRMLSNFETTQDKLLQIVLAGQPELDDLLKQPALRQLRQRRAIRATILPLTREESINYIKHRLAKAGAADTSIFEKAALRIISRQAAGIPRSLNILCDNALATGYAYGKKHVDAATAREVIRDIDEEPVPRRRGVALAVGAGCLLLLLGLAIAFFRFGPPGMADKHPPEVAHRTIETILPQPVETNRRPPAAIVVEDKVEPPPVQRVGKARRVSISDQGVTRTAKKGDTLSQLISEVYATGEPRLVGALLDELMKRNPHIKNADLILPGQTVFFPSIKTEMAEGLR